MAPAALPAPVTAAVIRYIRMHVRVLGIPTFLNEKSAETTPFLDILPKLPKLDIFASVYYGKCLFFEVLGRYYGKSLERLLF